MTRVLVAGIGNVFYRDDGFGVEVAHRLARRPPPATKVADFGIRALHLAYELLAPFELCVIADCMPRGGAAGSLYVVEPDFEADDGSLPDAHAMSVSTVFAAIRQLGGRPPHTLVVGCEPADVEAGIGLGPRVEQAVDPAIAMIHELVTAHTGDRP